MHSDYGDITRVLNIFYLRSFSPRVRTLNLVACCREIVWTWDVVIFYLFHFFTVITDYRSPRWPLFHHRLNILSAVLDRHKPLLLLARWRPSLYRARRLLRLHDIHLPHPLMIRQPPAIPAPISSRRTVNEIFRDKELIKMPLILLRHPFH